MAESRKTSLEVRDKSFFLNGEKFIILSGAMHYWRLVPEYWRDRMIKMKACGLKTVNILIVRKSISNVQDPIVFTGVINVMVCGHVHMDMMRILMNVSRNHVQDSSGAVIHIYALPSQIYVMTLLTVPWVMMSTGAMSESLHAQTIVYVYSFPCPNISYDKLVFY